MVESILGIGRGSRLLCPICNVSIFYSQYVMFSTGNGYLIYNFDVTPGDLDSNLAQTFLVRALDNVAWILGPSTASPKKETDDKVYVAIEKLEQPNLLNPQKSEAMTRNSQAN